MGTLVYSDKDDHIYCLEENHHNHHHDGESQVGGGGDGDMQSKNGHHGNADASTPSSHTNPVLQVKGYSYGLLQNCVVVDLRIAQNKSLGILDAHIKVNNNLYWLLIPHHYPTRNFINIRHKIL